MPTIVPHLTWAASAAQYNACPKGHSTSSIGDLTPYHLPDGTLHSIILYPPSSSPLSSPPLYILFSPLPIPPPRRAGGRPTKFPFKTLLPGESFFHPLPPGRTYAQREPALRSAARHAQVPITMRRVVEDGVPGLRVWRKAQGAGRPNITMDNQP